MNAEEHLRAAVELIESQAGSTSRLGFATKAGLRESTIRGIGSRDWSPSLTTLKKCAKAADALAKRGGRP